MEGRRERGECSICMEPLGEDDAAHELPCGHAFHAACIVAWAQSDNAGHGQCPVCRHAGSSTEFSHTVLNFSSRTKEGFERLLRTLQRHSGQLTAAERKTLRGLRSRAERTQRAEAAAREALKSLRAEHKKLFARQRQLQRRQWAAYMRMIGARKEVAALFPIVGVLVVRSGGRRGERAFTVRRSARLAAAQ